MTHFGLVSTGILEYVQSTEYASTGHVSRVLLLCNVEYQSTEYMYAGGYFSASQKLS